MTDFRAAKKDEYTVHNKILTASGRFIAKKRVFTIVVIRSDDDGWKMYNCPDCKNYLAQYKGDLVREVPGETPTAMPIKIQCKNPKCGRKILFDYSVEQT